MKISELVLVVLFVIYIVNDNESVKLATIVAIPQIKAVIVLCALLLFIYCHRVLGVLGIFVAYELLAHSHRLVQVTPTPREIFEPVTLLRRTMEEDIVFKMSPSLEINTDIAPYKPFSL